MFDLSQERAAAHDEPEIGRVLRASTTGFSVGCRVGQLSLPSFGSLVKAEPLGGGEAIYGLIYDMYVDDDPVVRRLVMAENPRLSVIEDQRNNRLLPIEMKVVAVGYARGGEIVHALPPRPPLNLDPVRLCLRPAEVRRFTDRPGYLRLLVGAAVEVPADQLVVAHVRQMLAVRGDDRAWAVMIVAELIELLRSNYDLLIPTLEAIGEALPAPMAGPSDDRGLPF
jgi:hypothetical protein